MTTRKISAQARHVLNLQANKEHFLSEAILHYATALLPPDKRIALQQQEIKRLHQVAAASECYIVELQEEITRLKANPARPPEPGRVVELPAAVGLSPAEKLAIKTDERVAELTRQVAQRGEVIRKLRANLFAAATRILKLSEGGGSPTVDKIVIDP